MTTDEIWENDEDFEDEYAWLEDGVIALVQRMANEGVTGFKVTIPTHGDTYKVEIDIERPWLK